MTILYANLRIEQLIIFNITFSACKMFKKEKDMAEKSRSLLKNKEVRKLRADVLIQFPSLSEESLTETINAKSQVVAVKLSTKSILYFVNDVPLLFDLCGRNDLYPSVFMLWKLPEMIPAITIHAPVSEFVLKGADLMLPGVSDIEGNVNIRLIITANIITFLSNRFAEYK